MNKDKPVASLSLDLDNKWSYMKTHGDPGWESFPSYLDVVVPRVLEFLEERELIITFFIVFFHPITTLISIIFVFFLLISSVLFKRMKKYIKNNDGNIIDFYNTKITLIILIVSFIFWYTTNSLSLSFIKIIFNTLS